MNPASIPESQWAAIRLFAMDVDGILTDGSIGISSDGAEVKFFSVLDGLGLTQVLNGGFTVAWISGRYSGATERRASELKIPHLIQGRKDKLAALQELAGQLKLAPAQCIYMGDDEIDAPAIRWAGVGVTVPGAMPGPCTAARYVTTRAAGHGAVREVCDRLLAAQGAAPS